MHGEDPKGRVISSRSHPPFLGHKGSLSTQGAVMVDGRPWDSPEVALVQDKEITRSIYRRFGGKLALNCFVIEGGEIAVGHEVRLVRGRACAEAAAAIEQSGSRRRSSTAFDRTVPEGPRPFRD